MYKFNIEFGDISQDGHERTAVFSIECSVDQHELEKLFNNACINTNFDFKEDAERKFIKGDSGYFLHSEYEDLIEDTDKCKSIEIDEM